MSIEAPPRSKPPGQTLLVIDEAYGLYGGGGNQGSSSDPYKTAVIDTIVAEVQSVPGDDRCVLLLGYKDQMETMFQNVNPGLSRRFPIASAFTFDDFSQDELRRILHLKLKQQGYQASGQAVSVAMEMLDRARNRPNFGNAGEIDILLGDTKARHQRRITLARKKSGSSQSSTNLKAGFTEDDTLLRAEDFDPNFDRAKNSTTNVRALFKDSVGSEQVVALLEGYQETVRQLKSLDMDPKESIPFNFLFRGPPGTGKTTTAKKMGKVFYDMGFLATADVEECSATDLIGQYVGHTGPKVQQLLDKALGRVLFIDEAYRLAEGNFAKEAMDEIVDSVTKPRYHKKLIIILAGYDADINRLMSVNTGLTSRFPEVVDFRPLTPEKCMALLLQLLRKKQEAVQAKGNTLDLGCLDAPSQEFSVFVTREFEKLSSQANWASARDVQSLEKKIFAEILRSNSSATKGLSLTEDMVKRTMGEMLREREARSRAAPMPLDLSQLIPQEPRAAQPPAPRQPITLAKTTTALDAAQAAPEIVMQMPEEEGQEVELVLETDDPACRRHPVRDAGVSDAVWEQLQRDQRAEEAREEEYLQLKERAKKASAAARDEIVRRLVEEERRRKEEMERRKKLEMAGICPMGYQWIKQGDGYRCAGGSHFVSRQEFAAM
ncbi:stage V sporulation protein K [Podospora conica]|nr:stage V sporulation protein K [Schizothecium conicum]